jgi:hypothetical protein
MSRFNNNLTNASHAPTDSPTDVTVGIDFGTSALKVAFREFEGRRSILISSPQGEALWPAVVQISEGAFSFARSDEKNVPTVRWLKMLLAEEGGAAKEEFRRDMRRTIGELGITIQCLATLLLAHVIKQARTQINEFFARQNRAAPHLTFNMGAPLETFSAYDSAGVGGSPVASSGFLEALYWAEKLSDQAPATKAWAIADARNAFETIKHRYAKIPSAAARTVFIVPETHAVVTGAVLSRRRLDPGQYVVVDIGAGTTDVAVFTYNDLARRAGKWAVTYLADSIKHEASTHADLQISELIRERMYNDDVRPPDDASLLQLAREAKEKTHGRKDIVVAGKFRLTAGDFRQCVDELCHRLFRHYRKTVVSSICNKTKNGHKEGFHLLLLGGGSRFRPFRDQFVGVHPNPLYDRLKPNEIWVSVRDHLVVLAGDRLREIAEQDFDLFLLVHGLTTHIVRLPEFWLPNEVDDMPPLPATDLSPYLREDDT